jgi:hypothetical protein
MLTGLEHDRPLDRGAGSTAAVISRKQKRKQATGDRSSRQMSMGDGLSAEPSDLCDKPHYIGRRVGDEVDNAARQGGSYQQISGVTLMVSGR